MDKKLLHLGLNLGPFTPNPHTLPSELSGTMKIFEGNDVYIQILNSDYLSTSPQIQKSDSVKCLLRRHCLAPPEGPGTQDTPGVNLARGVIPRRFKRKKFFVTNVVGGGGVVGGWTHRREGGNSG